MNSIIEDLLHVANLTMVRRKQARAFRISLIIGLFMIATAAVSYVMCLEPFEEPPLFLFYIALPLWFIVDGFLLKRKQLPARGNFTFHLLLMMITVWSPLFLVFFVYSKSKDPAWDALGPGVVFLAMVSIPFIVLAITHGSSIHANSYPKELPDREAMERFKILADHMKKTNPLQDPELVRIFDRRGWVAYLLKPVEGHIFFYALNHEIIELVPFSVLKLNHSMLIDTRVQATTNPGNKTGVSFIVPNHKPKTGYMTYRDLELYKTWRTELGSGNVSE